MDARNSDGLAPEGARQQASEAAMAAISDSGLRVAPDEVAALARIVARHLPAGDGTVRQALCEVRRRGWSSLLMDRARAEGSLWVTQAEARAAGWPTGAPC